MNKKNLKDIVKLIVGLGNVGKEYLQTRHNIGFMFLDFLNDEKNFKSFVLEKKFKSFISQNLYNNLKIILCKPITLMNKSGEAVQKIMQYFKIIESDIVLIHDDLDLKFGNYKIQKGKGPRSHNGILSVENHLKDKNFLRIRIGIESRNEEQRKYISGRDYVLSRFTKKQMEKLEENIFPKIMKDLEKYI